MTQQMRFNAGKPRLTYLFCARRALIELEEFTTDNDELVLTPLNEAMQNIVQFLDGGGRWTLANALIQIGCTIEKDVTGDEPNLEEMSAFEALAAMPNALEAFCATCDYGEGKYARGNFRKGAPLTQYLDSALRHILARLRGEEVDPESNCKHLGHALWNVVQALDQPEFRDDRLPPVTREPVSVVIERLCPASNDVPTTPPHGLNVYEAALLMQNGKTVAVLDENGEPTSSQLRCIHGKFQYKDDLGVIMESSFPRDYENARFTEVV